jgi:hypothetical protein
MLENDVGNSKEGGGGGDEFHSLELAKLYMNDWIEAQV